jgi:hypothetical protein
MGMDVGGGFGKESESASLRKPVKIDRHFSFVSGAKECGRVCILLGHGCDECSIERRWARLAAGDRYVVGASARAVFCDGGVGIAALVDEPGIFDGGEDFLERGSDRVDDFCLMGVLADYGLVVWADCGRGGVELSAKLGLPSVTSGGVIGGVALICFDAKGAKRAKAAKGE